MQEPESIYAKLKRIKPELSERYPIGGMALFGSYARGDWTEKSDVDILIDLNAKIGLRFIELAEELEQALGKQVDLVSKAGIKPKYFKVIEKDLIYV
jgi:predicted nucleotidyltransferase